MQEGPKALSEALEVILRRADQLPVVETQCCSLSASAHYANQHAHAAWSRQIRPQDAVYGVATWIDSPNIKFYQGKYPANNFLYGRNGGKAGTSSLSLNVGNHARDFSRFA